MSERLRAGLIHEIDTTGPMTFARFMERALYDPEDGFFAGAPVGRSADFVTSPHVSEVFGVLIARALIETWTALGAPAVFTVIEVGAGDGTLARQVLEAGAGDPAFAAALRYIAVEQGARAREALAAKGFEAHASLQTAAPKPLVGVIFANELLDNLPFHRVVCRNGSLREILVRTDGARLTFCDEPAPPELLTSMSALPSEGEERPASPAARAFVRAAHAHLARGQILLFDYGFTAGEVVEPIRGYRDQQLIEDLLTDPGATDITGPVDFDAIADEARALGLGVAGPVSQRDALHAFGYRSVMDRLRTEQMEADRTRDGRRMVELFSARNEAALLVEPRGLGGLKVIAFMTPDLDGPFARSV